MKEDRRKRRKTKRYPLFSNLLKLFSIQQFSFIQFYFLGPNTIALDASLGPDEVLSAALEACEVMMTIFFFFFATIPSHIFIYLFFSPASFLSVATLQNHHLIHFLPLTHHCTSQLLFYCKCQSLS